MKTIEIFYERSHFRQRMQERGFSVAEAHECFNTNDKKTRQGAGDEGGFREKFEKQLGARTPHVVAEVKISECWLITGYWQ